MDDIVAVIFHHQGKFVSKNNELVCEGWNVYVVENIDLDYLSYLDIRDVFCDILKYNNTIRIWIVEPFKKLAEVLILLEDDKALSKIIVYLGKIKKIHLYSKHGVNVPTLTDDFPNLTNIVSNLDLGPSLEKANVTNEQFKGVGCGADKADEISEFDHILGRINVDVDDGKDISKRDSKSHGEKIINNGVETKNIGLGDENDGSDGNKSEYLSSNDPGSYEFNDDKTNESKDDFVMRKSRRARYDRNTDTPIFNLGMEFIDAEEFRELVANYSISRGVQIVFAKNEPDRVRARCQEKCSFVIYASRTEKEQPLIVKTFKVANRCYRVFKNPRVTAEFIANYFKRRI
ncbi:hypothetical protein GH714_033161 [Hevea brasiliensis]|uniref:Uncharacterized protein n=1 Tax=Hevea brasiliensis TaxID=3981 RepID=A0A6A6L7B6_HEVBR|nr:hypothetical protein GH714_033161 [Hevea brasiliensis]